MKFLFFLSFLSVTFLSGQSISQRLETQIKTLMDTAPAQASSLSVYIADEKGNKIYEYNGNKGLSTASTQKIFTAAAALETLGKDFQYTTSFSYSGKITQGVLHGDFFVFSNGDPTLGSFRYEGYKPEDIKQKLLIVLKEKGITQITGNLILDDSYFDLQTTPGGWPWNDMGNYYGAGVWGINWRENQFDLKINGNKIQNTNVDLPGVKWVSEVKEGGNSDQSIIYTAPYSEVAIISGMLPSGKVSTVSGAMPNPPFTLGYEIKSWFAENSIGFQGKIISTSMQKINGQKASEFPKENIFLEIKSPTLDKIVYWFLRKSVNLYGENLIKTLAKKQKGEGNFNAGVDFLKSFWTSKGISPIMINFVDGSGLSPQNIVSSKAEVQALLYARKQPWFNEFYQGFPTLNGMKMKSGTIKNTKAFTGYHNGFVFSVIINNYQGNNSSDALFKILNILK